MLQDLHWLPEWSTICKGNIIFVVSYMPQLVSTSCKIVSRMLLLVSHKLLKVQMKIFFIVSYTNYSELLLSILVTSFIMKITFGDHIITPNIRELNICLQWAKNYA